MPDGDRARLFVALPLPPATRDALARLAPAAGPGVRPVAPDDLHVTLRFLGMADIASARGALAAVAAPAFTAMLTLPGQFFARGRAVALFAGVAPDASLRLLYEEVGRRLESAGFAPDARPYVPHITLARLDRNAGVEIIAQFLERSVPAEARRFDCREFALYASETRAAGARYRVLARFPLG